MRHSIACPVWKGLRFRREHPSPRMAAARIRAVEISRIGKRSGGRTGRTCPGGHLPMSSRNGVLPTMVTAGTLLKTRSGCHDGGDGWFSWRWRMGLQKLRNTTCFLIVSLILAGCGGSQPGAKVVSAAAPSISTQPTSQTVTVGQTATFSVMAAGTTPLSYQWQMGTTAITGATSATYTTPAATSAESGSQFSVVVSNAVGSMTSNPATLTVNPATPTAPSITQQPTNQTVTAGQTATFSVIATGTAPLSYQWQKGGSAITGATMATYTSAATTTSETGSQFSVVVSNAIGSKTSNSATLTVNPATTATTDVLTYHNDVGRTGQNL